ncbi:MAG: hypothetical protein IJ601_02340 [Acidaminococcaceae bacterium]|nr:hypothetical protein [Acidaminococcaceae bacterium]
MENLAIDITEKRNVQLAIDQLNEEIAKFTGDAYITKIHEVLVDMVTANPKLAEKLIEKKNILETAKKAVWDYASKHRKNNQYCMEGNDAIKIIMEKLGIKDYEKGGSDEGRKVADTPPVKRKQYVNLDDLL